MDFTSPSAFCALAITVLASCAMALPHKAARPIAATANVLNILLLFTIWLPGRNAPVLSILYPFGIAAALRLSIGQFNIMTAGFGNASYSFERCCDAESKGTARSGSNDRTSGCLRRRDDRRGDKRFAAGGCC